jgi:hypothetical protein
MFPSTEVRDKMVNSFNSGGIKIKLADSEFGPNLAKAVDGKVSPFERTSFLLVASMTNRCLG